MKVALCTLALNETEWLPRLYEQHKDWPALVSWVFVEGADRLYAEANPGRVSKEGLSVDGTGDFLRSLATKDPRVTYIPYGLSKSPDPGQGKCEMRNSYLTFLEDVSPDYLLVLDADEFYCRRDQGLLNRWVSRPEMEAYNAFILRYRNLWWPKCLRHLPMTSHEVVGGFWSIPHCHVWRWRSGLRHSDNHMTPKAEGCEVSMGRLDRIDGTPQCVHAAFASDLEDRAAKHRYYSARGEKLDRRRYWYVLSRDMYHTWQPGAATVKGAKVVPYDGPIPEVFR